MCSTILYNMQWSLSPQGGRPALEMRGDDDDNDISYFKNPRSSELLIEDRWHKQERRQWVRKKKRRNESNRGGDTKGWRTYTIQGQRGCVKCPWGETLRQRGSRTVGHQLGHTHTHTHCVVIFHGNKSEKMHDTKTNTHNSLMACMRLRLYLAVGGVTEDGSFYARLLHNDVIATKWSARGKDNKQATTNKRKHVKVQIYFHQVIVIKVAILSPKEVLLNST